MKRKIQLLIILYGTPCIMMSLKFLIIRALSGLFQGFPGLP